MTQNWLISGRAAENGAAVITPWLHHRSAPDPSPLHDHGRMFPTTHWCCALLPHTARQHQRNGNVPRNQIEQVSIFASVSITSPVSNMEKSIGVCTLSVSVDARCEWAHSAFKRSWLELPELQSLFFQCHKCFPLSPDGFDFPSLTIPTGIFFFSQMNWRQVCKTVVVNKLRTQTFYWGIRNVECCAWCSQHNLSVSAHRKSPLEHW